MLYRLSQTDNNQGNPKVSGRLGRLFQRYAAHHVQLVLPGPALLDADGQPLGRIERMALRHDRLVLEGRIGAKVTQVSLLHGGRRRSALPEPWPGGPGFRLDLPFVAGPAILEVQTGPDCHTIALPPLPRWRIVLKHIALVPGFVARSATALPAVLRWFRDHDPTAREEVRQCFGLGQVETAHPLDSGLFAPPLPPVLPAPEDGIVVILPVYRAFELLQECLARLVAHTDLPWRLIVIEDASPDARIRPWLRDWAAKQPAGQVRLLENDRNLGFIGSVNRGLAEAVAKGRPEAVVLLNSDALVPGAWASRLLAPLRADPAHVASVTPMSNDAELGCVPVICKRHDLTASEAEAIDQMAARLPEGRGCVEGPTGVGFCMALNPTFLARVPQFDTAFGRGYGEEVDWCQKVAAWGGRHLYQPRLFVEHRGGGSFGSVEKRRLLEKNGALISSRYPRFDADVQVFLAEDPLVSARLVLGLGLAAHRAAQSGRDGGRVPVYLAHAIGGGAEDWLRAQIAQDIAEIGSAVVLRVGSDRRWRIELHMALGQTWAETGDTELMQHVLGLLPARRMIYSCGVGDRAPYELPRILIALAQGPEHAAEVLFHDFFPISPSYTLLDGRGRWQGLPAAETTDRAHLWRKSDGSRIALAEWQAAWGALLAQADRVVVFAESGRMLVLGIWPWVADKLVVRPHAMPRPVPRLSPPAPSAPPVIGVLGNIGAHKGAGVLAALSRKLGAQRDPQGRMPGLVVLGKVDPAFRLVRPARIHGGYDLDDLPDLVRRYGITMWLIPSVWPESFSFTTHEAIATGLPVWCFDLGAQAEAVAKSVAAGGAGGILPLRDGMADPQEMLAHLLGHFQDSALQ
jgi:GT2 family glycosyltransferase